MDKARFGSPVLRSAALGVLLSLPLLALAQQQPRELSEADIAKLHQSVQKSKARTQAENQAAAERARLAEARYQEELRQRKEHAAIEAERQAAQDAQDDIAREAESAALRANFDAAREKSERELQDSIGDLQQTADRAVREQEAARQRARDEEMARANAQAARDAKVARQATDRQYAIGRQLEAQNAAADQARREREAQQAAEHRAALTVEQRNRPASPTAAPTASPAPAAPSEATMGFKAPTCAGARLAAQHFVGTQGSYEVKSETTTADGWCSLVIRNWKSSGNASFQ